MSKLTIVVVGLLLGLLLTSPTLAVFDAPPENEAGPSFSSRWAGHNQHWSHLGFETAWTATAARTPVVVAVLDSGVDGRHPEFEGRLLPGRNFVAGKTVADAGDEAGHGTSVAGIIVAVAGSGLVADADNAGNEGQPGVKILPVTVCNERHWCEAQAAIEGVYYAVEQGADVINMSFTMTVNGFWRSMWQAAIDHAHENGVVIVASAGNQQEFLSSVDEIHHLPAELAFVITVGAMNEQGQLCAAGRFGVAANCGWPSAPGSGYGPLLDVAAPGSTSLWTTAAGGAYQSNFGGSSAAAAFVAGLAARLRAANPALSPSQIERLLKENAHLQPMIPNSKRFRIS